MIPLEVPNSKSLISLLYKIDQDFAERTRAKNCPFAGVHFTSKIKPPDVKTGRYRPGDKLLQFLNEL